MCKKKAFCVIWTLIQFEIGPFNLIGIGDQKTIRSPNESKQKKKKNKDPFIYGLETEM